MTSILKIILMYPEKEKTKKKNGKVKSDAKKAYNEIKEN